MSDVWKKLLLHKASHALALHAPEGDYAATVGGLPEGVTLHTEPDPSLAGAYDFVHLFVASAADVEARAGVAIAAVKRGGLLWASYPKKSSKIKTDISRDNGWKPLRDAGFEAVTQIAIDDTWSALRFRPASEIKSLTRKFTND